MKWADLGALFTPTEKTKLSGIATGADVTGSNPPQGHAASHGVDGSDAVSTSRFATSAPTSPQNGDTYFYAAGSVLRIYKTGVGWGEIALSFE